MGPGPDRAFSATTTENIIHRISGTALDSDGLLIYVAALLVLVADIFAPADGLFRDSDGAPSDALAVPTSVLGFLALVGFYRNLDTIGLDPFALLLISTTALAFTVDPALTFHLQLFGSAR